MKRGLMIAIATALAGCSTPDTAMQLVREQQQIQRAAQDYEARQRADAVAPESAVYLSSIRRLQAEGRHFAALAHLDAYQNRFGDNGETALLRADALRVTGQRDASEAAYQALLSGPQSYAAWHGLGLLAAGQNDHSRALQALARAAALAPTNVDVLGDLGYARLRAGDRQGARIPLAQAAELAPDSPKAVANLALLMVSEGNGEAAEAVMTRAGLSDAARAAVRRQGALLAGVPTLDAGVARTGDPTTRALVIAPTSTSTAGRDSDRPVVRAMPVQLSAGAAGSVSRADAVASAETSPAVASELTTAPGPTVRPPVPASVNGASALDLYAAPLPSLLDRFAAGGATLQ